ncbi:class II aldolase/adducin family protein [Alloacidobacterium dinghuense]|uniref:Class II aldolase/adducin family protein n=1 Tax=Alloacidobacterium dinghuense TaxID=2763107 RepID=A0A7G8BEG6_9BACT|nr:class II aldolase/adducin family protein [Alloacidobacterium dinghuense]QNI30936.1 class II aldolase/adducin family protein [Alloacidobacterium dinghuense]
MTSQPAITLTESPAPIRPAPAANVVNIERPDRELRRQLTRFSKWMYRLGFAPGTSGNLSARLDSERILATPTGCSKYLLRASDMVIVDLNGKLLSGSRNVTSEIGMHLAVYDSRQDVQAVVHAHPPIATAFASCGMALDMPLCAELLMTLGKIPLAAYATTGTDEVGASLAPYVRDHDAILMANHGLVTYGKDLLDAFMKLETTEHFAQVCLAAHELGCPRLLEEDAIRKLQQARMRYHSNCRI